MNVVELSISGNDKQETRSGYNKIKIIRANETKNGITFTNNGDGSCTLNGTNNATGAIYFNLNLDSNNAEYFTLTKNKKYYMYLKGLKAGTALMARSRNNQNFSLITNDSTSKITEWTKETATDGIAYIEVQPGTTFNNETFYPMLAESDVELEYEAYGAMPSPSYPSEVETVNTQVNIVVENEDGTKQQTKVVDIQQEMLEGDYFVKEEDGWKEVHGWNKKIFDGTENISITNNGNSFSYIASDILANTNINKVSEIFSNYYRASSWNDRNTNNTPNTISYYNIAVGIYKGDFATVEEFKADLAQKYTEGNPVYVWYKLATPLKLACTEKQIEQLDDLLNTSTYKNVTHIYSTDKVSPIIKIKYKKDLETMLNSQKNDYDTRLSNIEKLLSTTTTSALLLDNLQTDIQKEVM